RREVVRALDRLDLEAPVFPRPRLALLEHDHAPDRVGALDVRDVVALDPERRPRQPERLRQLLERREGLALVREPARLLARERLARVPRREDHELPLLPPLWDREPRRPATPGREERLQIRRLRPPERPQHLR